MPEEDKAREDAGCILWDLSAAEEHGRFLLEHLFLEVVEPVLQDCCAKGRDRLVEILSGTLGNLACQAALAEQIAKRATLRSTVVRQALWVDDAAALGEVCRLLATALARPGKRQWLAEMLGDATCLGRLMWIVDNTLNAVLLQRSLNLVNVLACEAPQSSIPQLLELGVVPAAIATVRNYMSSQHTSIHDVGLPQMDADAGRNGADAALGDRGVPQANGNAASLNAASVPNGDGSAANGADNAASAAACLPSEAAVDAALRVLEALASHEAGFAAIQETHELSALLIAVLRASESNLVRGSAVVVLSALADLLDVASPFSQDAGGLRQLLQLLKDPETADEADVRKAALALLAAACRHMATAGAPLQVLQVLAQHVDAVTQNSQSEPDNQVLRTVIADDLSTAFQQWLATQHVVVGAEREEPEKRLVDTVVAATADLQEFRSRVNQTSEATQSGDKQT
ncbi:hypothetical protein WJX72_002722 [[Myrmecia] bisecta]|uniref:Uncharacterized protein n=1 Tax=[Myrmecia] bisecta TaxID=41462 RepID=A0AAW1PK39_9CHLO